MTGSSLALLLALAAAPELARAEDGSIPPPQPPPPQEEAPAAEPPATAGEPVPPPPPPPPPPDAPAKPATGNQEGWLDVGHAFIEQRVFAPVLRVDRFFSDERDLEAERSRSFIRWRNEVRLAEYVGSPAYTRPAYTTSLTANLRLPGLNKQLRRLRIEIAGQTRDAVTALFPGENPQPGDVPAPEENLGTADAGLRLRIWDTVTGNASLGGGVLVRLPPGVYGRLRFRFVEPLGRRFLARQALSLFWRSDTRFGTVASAEFERPLARTLLTRLSGSSTLTEVSRGVEWSGDLSLLATFRERLGVQVGTGLSSATDAVPWVERYRVYTRVRRDFYRRWIFLELEPEYAWPWTVERGRHSAWGVALRLEVQFQGNEPPAPQPPPAPPADPAG